MSCHVKIFRVASDKFCLGRHRYSQVIMAVYGLIGLRLYGLNYLINLTQYVIFKIENILNK
ncbi:MAG: hypothetical protein ACYT04_91620, partial [Nostoc sp.]